MNTNQLNEKGQAIGLLVVAIVALLGFAALAIDGGMLYSDRRHAQNAADTAALAGAGDAARFMGQYEIQYSSFVCGSGPVIATENRAISSAIDRAGSNGYAIDDDVSDKHGVTTLCEIVDTGTYLDKHFDVITRITRETNTSFAHLLFPNALVNEVEAVARVYPPYPLAFGKAVVGLNEADCSGNSNGVIFSGDSLMNIKGGGVFSNGCMNCNGTSFEVAVTDGDVGYAGTTDCGGANINPFPQKQIDKIPDNSFDLPAPTCPGPSRTVPSGTDVTLEPGNYDTIKWTGGSLKFNPGLYCITGSQGFDVTGGSVSGNNITIYLTSGGVTINGNVQPINLRAPVDDPDPWPAFPGILFYLAVGNTSTVSLTGNGESFFLGTVYVPSGDIYISGTSGTNPTFNTQLIANNVEISGNATVDIEFNEGENYLNPPYIELQR